MFRRVSSFAVVGLLVPFLACNPPAASNLEGDREPVDQDPPNKPLVEPTKSADASASDKPSLIVTLKGAGQGTITSTPAGVTCSGTECRGSFAPSTKVSLVATPAAGSFFVGWKGACTGTGPCAVEIRDVVTVEAELASFDGTTWTGTYNGQKRVGSCFANNAGALTIRFTQKGGKLSSKVDMTGIDLRNTMICSTAGTTNGSSGEADTQLTGLTLFGTWDVSASGPTSQFSYPFMAQIGGTTLKGSWRCDNCPGDFTATKQ